MNLTPFEQDRKKFILDTLAKGKAVRFENEHFVKIVDKWDEDTSQSREATETQQALVQSDLVCCYSNGFSGHVAWWHPDWYVSEQELNEVPKN